MKLSKIINNEKFCNKCKTNKSIENFYITRSGIVKTPCKECALIKRNGRKEEANISNTEYRKNNKEKIAEYGFKYRINNKEDISNYNKKYREANPEKIKELGKKNREENKSENSLKNKKYRENNKIKINNKRRVWEKERQKDPFFRVKKNISGTIRKVLKSNFSSKNGKSFWDNINYTKDEFKIHIEKQFEYWMDWNNYGPLHNNWDDFNQFTWKWNIDHIIPQSDLPYSSMDEENFKKCWALDNLRPMSAKINTIEGAKRIRHKI